MKGRGVFGAALLALFLLPANPAAGEEEEWLSFTYRLFDQTVDSGWRAAALRGDWGVAADMIDRYRSRNASNLSHYELLNLNFHRGQMLAFDGRTAEAIADFKASFLPGEAASARVPWNAYVAANVAFLEGRREDLLALREEVARGKPIDGVVPNLGIVDALVRNFGGPYLEAYRIEAK